MKKEIPVQSIIDPFVLSVGGRLVSDLVDTRNAPPNADYYFPEYDVVAELKSLQAGGFASSFRRKLEKLAVKWQRQRRLIIFGTVQIRSSKLPPDCREEVFAAMADSMQKRLVVEANRQIRSTKVLLGRPSAMGLLWIASDGNDEFQPDDVWYTVNRILQKKKREGEPAYSSIDAVAYFNPRMPVRIADNPNPGIFFLSRPRGPGSSAQLNECLKLLGDRWPEYFARTRRATVQAVSGSPSDLVFPGGPKVPRIEPDYDK